MVKKNKWFLAGILVMLMILLVSCGKKSAGQPTEATAAQTPSVYTVTLRSDSDYPLEGIGIYVYTDATRQELVWFARTDAEGKITFRDVTYEGYIAVLDGVSTDYVVQEHYPPREGDPTTHTMTREEFRDKFESLGMASFDSGSPTISVDATYPERIDVDALINRIESLFTDMENNR